MSPPDEAEVQGVKVRLERLRSGPAWRWKRKEQRGVTTHQRIQWLPENYRWLRHSSVTDSEDGGWNVYPVHYRQATDEDEAWAEVQRVLELELSR